MNELTERQIQEEILDTLKCIKSKIYEKDDISINRDNDFEIKKKIRNCLELCYSSSIRMDEAVIMFLDIFEKHYKGIRK